MRKIKPVKLDEPIAHGFIKSLVFRNETKLRKDFSLIKEAFEFVGHRSVYSKNRDFAYKSKSGKITYKKPWISSVTDPRFSFFRSERQRADVDFSINKFHKYLRCSMDIYSCNCDRRNKDERMVPHWEFKFPFWLEEKVDIHWLTHYTPIDSAIESRLAEIRNIFRNRCYWELLKMNHRDYDDNFEEIKAESHAILHGWPRPTHLFSEL